jgi:hypothetical protein
MPLEAPFAAYRDVDLAIILDSIIEQDIDDANYEGLILEAILVPAHRYTDAAKLLSDACNASILAADHSILLDPRGQLAPIAEEVQRNFARRKWVTARRDEMLQEAQKAFKALAQAENIQQALFALGELNMYLIATLTTVRLTPLTHRRNMLQLKQIIRLSEEKEMFEKLHRLLGSAHFTPDKARDFLAHTTAAFDCAVQVHKTPVPFDHKLDPCVRPYLVQGTEEMFDEDGYRESVFWIALFLMISCAAIQADGDDAAKAKYLPYAGELLQTMGLATPDDLKERTLFAQQVLGEMKQLTDHIIATSPDILVD